MTLSSSLSVSEMRSNLVRAASTTPAWVTTHLCTYWLRVWGRLFRGWTEGDLDRGGFGPKATATGVHPASRAATGREAVPANHVRQRWESKLEQVSLWCGFTKKSKGKD